MFFKQISDLKNARILICNDDGIDAEGIKILEEETSKICGDVWVAAPDRQKSSSGHANVSSMLLPRNCTSAEEVGQIKKIDDRHFAIDGTPGDCVYMALRFLFRDKHPDLLLSGVNFGRNLAEDVTYSGTIGAAMEGIIRGVPAIAFSQHMGENARQDWDASRHFIRPLLERLTKFSFPMNTLVNVNFPDCPADEVRGVKLSRIGEWRFTENPPEYKLRCRRNYTGQETEKFDYPADYEVIAENKISVTPISVDLTDYASLPRLADILKDINIKV